MNIIVPEDDSIDMVVIDLRDALMGTELVYDAEKGGIAEYTIFCSKKDLVKPGEEPTAENVLKHLKNGDYSCLKSYIRGYCDTAKMLINYHPHYRYKLRVINNIKYSLENIKPFSIKPDEKSVFVTAPLFRNSTQFMEVRVETTPAVLCPQGEQYLAVYDAGACPNERLREIEEKYIDTRICHGTKVTTREDIEEEMGMDR